MTTLHVTDPSDASFRIDWEMTVVLLVAVRDEMLNVVEGIENTVTAPPVDGDVLRVYFLRIDSVLIRVILAKTPSPGQGGDPAALLTTRLAERYKPYLIAMVGLCAGDESKVALGDVVVASATYRHDHGRLSDRWWPNSPDFSFRSDTEKIRDHLADEITLHLRNATYGGFHARIGVISTGNQVIRVAGVFDYFHRKFGKSLTGDEASRELLALDMEAHAVAYAARNSGVPCWLIVKGIADYATARKNDDYHHVAVRNARVVFHDLLVNVLAPRFISDVEPATVADEAEARRYFAEGNLPDAARLAARAHAAGRRTAATRRRYLKGLSQLGQYDIARQIIAGYRRFPPLYDTITRGFEAKMLWRNQEYDAACAVLPDDLVRDDPEAMYLRAMSEAYANESRFEAAYAERMPSTTRLEKARDLLVEAIARTAHRGSPWWFLVNFFWIQRLLGADAEALDRIRAHAIKSLHQARESRPGSGTPRLYELLLLAVADDKNLFDRSLEKLADPLSVSVALETLDTVFVRLAILRNRGVLSESAFTHYWSGISHWIRQCRTLGNSTFLNSRVHL